MQPPVRKFLFNNMNVNNDNALELGTNLSIYRRIAAYYSILIIYFFYCYSIYLLSVLGPFMRNHLHFSNSQCASLYSITSLGTLFGTIIAGKMSLLWGRKITLQLLGIAFALFTLAHILTSESFVAWAILRLFCGVAIGGVFGTSTALIVGLFPQRYSGRLNSFAACLFALSGVLAGKIAECYLDTHWTMVLWCSGIPTLVGVCLVQLWVPSDSNITKQQKGKMSFHSGKQGYSSMLQGKYLWIGLLAVFLSGMNFSGYSGFSQFFPIYLQNGLDMSTKEWTRMIQLQDFGQFIGFNFWGWIGDRFGRKKSLAGMLLCSALIPVYLGLDTSNIQLLFAISLLYGISLGYSGIWGAYYTELFPAKFRSLSAGFCFNMGRAISMLTVFGVGIAADSLGIKHGLLIPAVFFALGCIAWMLLPETLANTKTIQQSKTQSA
ncbi:Gentisate transporter [invertebrate metagenome]|uniref:Gentisate transporter n=1 Tax=invertebrate metagenome TaxID=1711999 RepID=A0A2H9T622_9ZZZZ